MERESTRIVTSVTPVGTTSRSSQITPIQDSPDFDNQDVLNDVSFAEPLVNDDVMAPEGVSLPEQDTPPSVSTGVSSRGRQRRMSRAMQESVSQRSFYGDSDMHYMQAYQAITSEEAEIIMYTQEHDFHLGLQDRMRHPIAFHAEMMGDIMYFHQSLL
jgi:hypothetical protein